MSALWIGRRQSVGIGREIVRGTGVAPSYWLNCLSFNYKDVPTKARSEAGTGGIWIGDQAPVTLIHAEGDMEVELGDQSLAVLLYALLGVGLTSGPTDTAAYTHTYTLQNDNQHDSLTIHTIDPIGQLAFEMSMIDVFELRIEPNAIISATVSFISKPSVDSGGQTASYGAEKKFVGRNLTFEIAATTASLGNVLNEVDLKSLTLRFEKNAEAVPILSSVHPEDIINKQFNITGEIVLNNESRTFLNYVKDGDYKAIRIDLTHEDTITGCATAKYQFRLDLSKVEFESWEPDFAMDEVVTETLSFTALFDAGLNNNVINSCYLVNAIDDYSISSFSPSLSPSISPSLSPSVSPS